MSSLYTAACLLHLRNTSFASMLGDRQGLVGLIIRPDWLKTLSLAAKLHGIQRRAAKQYRSFVLYENKRNRKICLNVHL